MPHKYRLDGFRSTEYGGQNLLFVILQWHTQEFFLEEGEVQQIQLKTGADRMGIWGRELLVRSSTQFANE
jgi:hypothetical protein